MKLKKIRNKSQSNPYLKYSGIGLQMFVIIGLGIWGGMKLNEYFEFEKPILTAISALVSILVAMLYVIKTVKKG